VQRDPSTSGTLPTSVWTGRVLRAVAPLFVVAFFVPALFVAFVLPYRYWDSLAFGTWSRLIAETGTGTSRIEQDWNVAYSFLP